MTIQSEAEFGLIDLFQRYFEVIPANTPERLKECYQLRYQVYYEEGLFQGMNTEDCPDRLEHDEYDQRSKHCLLIYKPENTVAGTVRIILDDQEKLNAKFPLETIVGDSLFSEFLAYDRVPRSCLGEISRLILTPEFRARKGERKHSYGGSEDLRENSPQKNECAHADIYQENSIHFKNIHQRKFPHAILGLFVGIVRMSFENNVSYWYANMDPACARFLRFFGINFMPISSVIDFHGPRQGYFGSFSEIMENIHRTNPQVWSLLTDNGAFCPQINYPLNSSKFI